MENQLGEFNEIPEEPEPALTSCLPDTAPEQIPLPETQPQHIESPTIADPVEQNIAYTTLDQIPHVEPAPVPAIEPKPVPAVERKATKLTYDSTEAQPVQQEQRAGGMQHLQKGKNKQKYLERLYKENSRLKKQLAAMSEKLNDEIEVAQKREELKQKAKPKNMTVRPGQDIETAKSKLAHYKTQHAKIKTRYEQIMKPETHQALKESIEQLAEGIQEKQTQIRNKTLEQKARSKKLEQKLDSGESKEMLRQFYQLRDELVFYNGKCSKLEKICTKNASGMQQLSNLEAASKSKSNEHRTQYKQIPKEIVNEEEVRLKEMHDQLMKEHQRNCRVIDNSISKLKASIFDVQKEQKHFSQQRGALQKLVTSRDADLENRRVRLETMRAQAQSVPSLQFPMSKKGIPSLRAPSTTRNQDEKQRVGQPAFITEGETDDFY